jgi:hypothetical protein
VRATENSFSEMDWYGARPCSWSYSDAARMPDNFTDGWIELLRDGKATLRDLLDALAA